MDGPFRENVLKSRAVPDCYSLLLWFAAGRLGSRLAALRSRLALRGLVAFGHFGHLPGIAAGRATPGPHVRSATAKYRTLVLPVKVSDSENERAGVSLTDNGLLIFPSRTFFEARSVHKDVAGLPHLR